MIGVDQDDILSPPGRPSATGQRRQDGRGQPELLLARRGEQHEPLYPGSQPPLSRVVVDDEPHGQDHRADQILVKAESTEQIPLAIEQITELLTSGTSSATTKTDDFRIHDMTEVAKGAPDHGQLC